MLALLDHQQKLVELQGGEDLIHSISAIDAQSAAIQAARANRTLAQSNLAEALSQGRASAFADLIPLMPENYRPLARALMQENHELSRRVRQRAQENHLLLGRSLEKMQRFISTLSEQDHATALSRDEERLAAVEPGPSLYEAII